MESLSWQDFLDQLTKAVKQGLDQFQRLKSDEERAGFCLNDSPINKHLDDWLERNIDCVNIKKKEQSAYTRLKSAGNSAYVSKKNMKALELYNEVMFHSSKGINLAFIYGNRSAVLFAESRFGECLVDIDLAISNDYPQEKIWKLYKRKGETLCKLKRYSESRESLQKSIDSIDTSNCPKLESEIEHLKTLMETIPTGKDEVKETTADTSIDPWQGWSQELKYGSCCITKKFDEKQGRYIVANKTIPSGSVIIAEKPYAAVLLNPWHKTHCQHCFVKVVLIFSCHQCSEVGYCSENCRLASWESYHHFECGKLELLEKLGISRLALRIIVTTPLSELRRFRESLLENLDPSAAGLGESGVYEGDYTSVYHLLPHSQHFLTEDLFQYSLAGVMLLKILAKFSFIEEVREDGNPICGLLIRHIQQLVCNAHAITSLSSSTINDASNVIEQDQVRIATAIYPTTSLLNHSCEPTIVNCFQKDRLIVKTNRKIEAGEQIFNCYGPHFRRMDFTERQEALSQQYFFACRCTHCLKGVVSTSELNCYQCDNCNHAIINQGSSCKKCGVDQTDRFKYCKEIEQICTENFNNGVKLLAAHRDGRSKVDVQNALKLFKRCLENQTAVLYKYHKKLGQTNDAIGRCHALMLEYKSSVMYVKRSVSITEMHYGRESVETTNELLKLSDVYMAFIQQLIDQQNEDKKEINEYLPDVIEVVERTSRLVEINKEPGNEDLELLKERLGSLIKLKYICQNL